MTLFLGVDGGGTKTAFVLLDGSGRVLANARLSSAYYFTDGIATVEAIVSKGVDEVCRAAGTTPGNIDHAFFGLPGYGEASADISKLDALPRGGLGHDRYTCGNDTICSWAGSLAGADGINVVSGTGSITYGEREGRGHRVGGWGELFGDEGSGYWIAIRGLNAFTRMSDGRLPRGPLYDAIKSRMNVTQDLDVIGVVFNEWRGQRSAIAALSTSVAEADARGDLIARGILADACAQLAEIVDTTRLELGFGAHATVPVSYSGGVFNAEVVRQGFARELAARYPDYDLRAPQFDPAVGAALYAAKQSGRPLSRDAFATLRGG